VEEVSEIFLCLTHTRQSLDYKGRLLYTYDDDTMICDVIDIAKSCHCHCQRTNELCNYSLFTDVRNAFISPNSYLIHSRDS